MLLEGVLGPGGGVDGVVATEKRTETREIYSRCCGFDSFLVSATSDMRDTCRWE